MLLSTKMMISKAETVFQTLGFCPNNKNFDVEDIKAAAFSTLNHTVSLEDGLKVAKCYVANKHLFKKMVKAVSHHFDEYYGHTAVGKVNIKFTNYSTGREIYHVSNALTDNPNTAMAIGRNMQVESSFWNNKYYFRRDKTYYITPSHINVSDMVLYNSKDQRICVVHMDKTSRDVELVENKTNFDFVNNGDSCFIYEKGKMKTPIGMMKWDALNTTEGNGLLRFEVLDSHANYEQLLHIGLAILMIYKRVKFSEGLLEVANNL